VIEPLRMAFEVNGPAEHAFNLWTQRTSSWWPVSHTVTAEPGLQVVFEGRPGGRIFERTSSGREVDWGQVTVWEPPKAGWNGVLPFFVAVSSRLAFDRSTR